MTTSQPRCTHRVWDQGAHVVRECGGKHRVTTPDGPRCLAHSPERIAKKRAAMDARVKRAVERANALAATLDP